MDDKLIEDLDVDFIKDILVSSDELQMADNFIEDFMGELNKNLDDINNQQNIQSFWNSNKQDNHEQNFDNQNYIHHQNNQDQNQSYNNMINNQTNNFAKMMQPILLSPTITNESFNMHQSYQHIESQPISCLNKMNQFNTDFSSTKKVGKNLKELLNNNDTNALNGTTPALILNQDSSQLYNFNNSKIETGYTKQKARSISSIINSNNNTNNNTNTIDLINLEAKNNQFHQNKANENMYQVNVPNIQIVIGNTQQLIPLQTNQTVEQISENKRKYNKKKISNLTTNENEPAVNSIENSKPFKLLDLADITPRKPKFKKKTDHNAIEKKYRSSINDKIIELKTRVAGPDAKLQKSGILKKALEYITNIEDVNKRLCDENRVLRSALNTISLNLNNPEKINQALRNVNYLPFIPADSLGPNTPPTSFDGDSLYSSHESDFSLSTPSSVSSSQSQSPPSSPVKHESTKTQKRTYKKAFKKEAMLDTSRIMLCMVVMSVLFFNPFNLIINSNVNQQNKIGDYQNNKGINSRVLNSFEDAQFFNNSINSSQMNRNNQIDIFISWFLNLILILICLIVIYIKGEPYMELNSNDDTLWLNYQMARKRFERKNYEETMDFCEKGIKELGQKMPKTHFQLIVGIMWQLVRLTLDKIYIGRLFSKIGIWLYDLKSLKMYKLSALFHYEMHKFSYLNLKSENEFTLKSLTYTTTYSYLTAFYHLISAYNMSEMYSSSKQGEMNLRDEYNLCEIYFSIVLYLKFYFPSKLSKFLINHLVTKNLASKLSPSSLSNQEEDSKNKQFCKLNKLKSLLKNCLFIQFTIDFENYLKIGNKSEFDSLYRQKTLNLISYKNKIFNTSFLYDSDDSVNNFETIKNDEKITAGNGVACDFILNKFQDFILFKMTNHIINRTGMVTTENIINSSNINNNNRSNSNGDSIDLMTRSNEDNYMNEEQKEVADIDQIKFDRLKLLYENNLQYFSSSKFKKTTISDETVKQTQEILLVFLNMLNNWKLRKFDLKINSEHLVNVKKSDFIESILSVLKAYEHVFTNPQFALQHCNIAIKSLKVFNQNPDFNVNNHLIEKFELLINDWVLSAQSHIWVKHRITQLDLFNQSLRNFQTLISNYPQLSLKAKMYETILLYTSNRNPVKLLSPTCKQTVFSKSNQDAYFSMNLILKQFQLQLLD